MSDTHTPADAHPAFDAMCSEVEEFGVLPTVTPQPAPSADEERTAPLDELILAGLVSP
ncbi:MAG TPA: hypothetical protein VG294_08440 [Solirubrobacteraceae bacterium]|jgi:hypothetical protein|nr:hypothetical protein [Solirubrobacteraceae bacterium]